MTTEKIEKIEQKIEQLKNQKKAIVQREKEKERKARTRRLIQNGALVEKYFDCENISPEDLDTLLQEIISIDAVKLRLKEKRTQEIE